MAKPEDNLPAKKATAVAFRYGDVDVMFNDERLVCLTDMWKAVGSPINLDPPQWVRYAGGSFVADLASHLNMGKSHVIKTRRGKGVAGTWAHWQIAMAYAKYLSTLVAEVIGNALKSLAKPAVILLALCLSGCVSINAPLFQPPILIDRACPAVMVPGPGPVLGLGMGPGSAADSPPPPPRIIRSEPMELTVPNLTPTDPIPIPMGPASIDGGGALGPKRQFASRRN